MNHSTIGHGASAQTTRPSCLPLFQCFPTRFRLELIKRKLFGQPKRSNVFTKLKPIFYVTRVSNWFNASLKINLSIVQILLFVQWGSSIIRLKQNWEPLLWYLKFWSLGLKNDGWDVLKVKETLNGQHSFLSFQSQIMKIIFNWLVMSSFNNWQKSTWWLTLETSATYTYPFTHPGDN